MNHPEPSGTVTTGCVTSTIDRRAFLKMAGAASAGLPLLLTACGVTVPVGPAGATAGPTPGAAAAAVSAGKLQLPTYVPLQGVKPDLPPSEAGLQAGFLSYPKDLVKSVAQAPGLGGDVTAFSQATGAAPPALDQNPAWQAVNKQLNANMKIQLVASADYNTKLATIMAGNDLPDLLFVRENTTIGNTHQFLKASFSDLAPYLAGDAVKDYPNLATFPASAWKQMVLEGTINAVPITRAKVGSVWYLNQNLMDSIGASQPKSADDFKRILKELTRPQSNQWGMGAYSAFGLISATGRGDNPQLAMFGVPNNWTMDASGKFIKDIETEQFKVAVGFVRDLFADGVFFPDPLSSSTARIGLLGGKYAVVAIGWSSYASEAWDPGLKLNPPMRIRIVRPLSADGGKPIYHQSQGLVGRTAIKKASPDRVKELLRVLNYLAAPFGSQEAHLLEYGVKDIDFEFDGHGNPVLTPKGLADTSVPWRYLAQREQVLTNPDDPEFVKAAYADMQAFVPALVADASLGLYSETDRNRGNPLNQKLSDGLSEIVTGRSPMNTLDQLVQEWRSGGGEQMRTEFQRAYADAQK